MKTPAPNPPVLLVAGGTGGHVFPAEALAVELGSRGRRLVLVTDGRGAAFGDVLGRIERHAVPVRNPAARGACARGVAALAMVGAVLRAVGLLRRIRPAVAVGFGSYPSLPAMVATGRLGIPSVLHEQNAVLGRANRMLARRAVAIATSFPETARIPRRRSDRVVHVGNPIRAAVAALRDEVYEAPAPDGPFRLLVTGGSQGARVFAEVVPPAVAALPGALRRRIEVSQQCREEDLEQVERQYAEAGVRAHLSSFFDDMPVRLRAAHLAICRAGASTVAELAVAGRAAVLVPLPIATDDHQSVNGRALAAAGAAMVIRQDSFTPARLAQEIAAAMEHPARLADRAAAARRLARPDAARTLANLVESVIGARRGATPARAGGTA